MTTFNKKILITATAYPLPSRSYDELVCTAGIDEKGNWFRIYPVPLKFLIGLRKNKEIKSFKYTWIEIELKKKRGDRRPESYSPVSTDLSKINVLTTIGTNSNWYERRKFCLNNVCTNMKNLITDSREPKNKSLAVFKPSEIIDFVWEEEKQREWKDEWKKLRKQDDLFEGKSPEIIIRKLPYKFYYQFKDDSGNISRLRIEDWEIGALYWNCLQKTNNVEPEALKLVKAKFYDELARKRDLHLFLGTTLEWHYKKARNPFVIIGIFYPPKEDLNLFPD